jgi:hypothetical protein
MMIRCNAQRSTLKTLQSFLHPGLKCLAALVLCALVVSFQSEPDFDGATETSLSPEERIAHAANLAEALAIADRVLQDDYQTFQASKSSEQGNAEKLERRRLRAEVSSGDFASRELIKPAGFLSTWIFGGDKRTGSSALPEQKSLSRVDPEPVPFDISHIHEIASEDGPVNLTGGIVLSDNVLSAATGPHLAFEVHRQRESVKEFEAAAREMEDRSHPDVSRVESKALESSHDGIGSRESRKAKQCSRGGLIGYFNWCVAALFGPLDEPSVGSCSDAIETEATRLDLIVKEVLRSRAVSSLPDGSGDSNRGIVLEQKKIARGIRNLAEKQSLGLSEIMAWARASKLSLESRGFEQALFLLAASKDQGRVKEKAASASAPKKVAFLFLTKGPLPLAALWEAFFEVGSIFDRFTSSITFLPSRSDCCRWNMTWKGELKLVWFQIAETRP